MAISPHSLFIASGTTVFETGTRSAIEVDHTITPVNNSVAEYRSFYFRNFLTAATGITQNTIGIINAENRVRCDGLITDTIGAIISTNVADSNSPATIQVTSSTALKPSLFARPSGTTTASIATGIGIDFATISATGAAFTSLTFISIPNATATTVGTQIGIDIGTLSRGTVDIGVRIAKSDTYSLQLSDTGGTSAGGITFGTDTTLYRNGVSILKTDAKLIVGTELNVVGDLNHDGTNVGFYGVAPTTRPSAYTQTYATADKTLGAYTSDTESVAYTGIDNLQAGTPYATVADLNQLRVAYENLRAFAEDAVAMLNSLTDDLQSLGLAS